MKDDKKIQSKAALAPGTMIPAAGEPWEEMTVPRPGGGALPETLPLGLVRSLSGSRVVHLRHHSAHATATPAEI